MAACHPHSLESRARDFGQVWTPGTVLQLRDDTNGIDSVKQTVWDPVAPRLCPPCPDGPDFRIDLAANPEADYYLNHGSDLSTWLPAATMTTDGYGMADFSGLYSAFSPPRFFQAEEVPLIP